MTSAQPWKVEGSVFDGSKGSGPDGISLYVACRCQI
jgi:hypothetical protein